MSTAGTMNHVTGVATDYRREAEPPIFRDPVYMLAVNHELLIHLRQALLMQVDVIELALKVRPRTAELRGGRDGD
jgi:hypothetical protein